MSDRPEVGSGAVAIIPTFRGFRTAVASETDASTRASASSFTRGFTSAGTTAGKGFGSALSAASGPGLKAVQADIARAASAVSTARLREADAAGKVRVAEASLAEARAKYAADSAQVVRAEERLASSERALQSQQTSLTAATSRLSAARLGVSSAAETAATSGLRLNNVFGTLPSIFKVNGSESGQKFLTGFTDVLGGVVGANILTGVGFAVGRGINDVITGGIKAALSSISLASDLNETTSAVTQVFGPDAAQGIVAFSKTADKALAQTQQQALLGAQTFGVFGKAAGLQGSKLVGFSTGLVQLAGDLASFYNTTPDDAITAITAGLRGESEPLRQYGVLLDDASLRQEALRLRIVKTTKDALTPQQRVLAAQSLIMKQTTIAQGDFQRTSGGLANSQRILSAEIANTQAQLGTFLLPAFTSFVHYASTDILPAVGSLIDKYGPQLGAALQAAKPGVKALVDDLGPLADKVVSLIGDKGIPGLIKISDDFVKSAPAWIDAFQAIDKGGSDFLDSIGVTKQTQFQTDVHDSFVHGAQQIGDFFNGVADALKKDPAHLRDGFKQTGIDWNGALAEGIKNGGKDQFFTAWQGVKDSSDSALKGFSFDSMFAGAAAGQGLADGISSKKDVVGKAAKGIADEAVSKIKSTMKIQSPSRVTRSLGAFAGDGYALGLSDRTRAVQDSASRLAAASLVAVGAGASGGSGAGGSQFGIPPKVTLVDSHDSILGHMDVRVAQYDADRSATQARGSRGL